MIDPAELIGHWGYPAIFVLVLLGSAGIPVPEESILVVGGYLAWRGQLRLPLVIAIGILSATAGDNLGYWVARHYGRTALDRYGSRFFITSARLEAMRSFVLRSGAPAVFIARFVPGLRVWAGPIAGAAGMPFPVFVIANALGAVVYVPLAVGAGYALGLGVGQQLERLRAVIGELEYWAVGAALAAAAGLLLWRAVRARR
ncbi:MAG TPA: DedA family protein [Methylomirabilota bacterium]|nr:DedA family protein [Methylomirabilota bacterium]